MSNLYRMSLYPMEGSEVAFIAQDGTAHAGVVIGADRFTEMKIAHAGTISYVPWNRVVLR